MGEWQNVKFLILEAVDNKMRGTHLKCPLFCCSMKNECRETLKNHDIRGFETTLTEFGTALLTETNIYVVTTRIVILNDVKFRRPLRRNSREGSRGTSLEEGRHWL